jgi:glycosyltransferase involved in cell wall biosynthesis
MKLSIIIPCFNEEKTIETLLSKVLNLDLGSIKKEVIVVDDGSFDKTKEILEKFKHYKEVKIIHHQKNLGKGEAIKTALNFVTGDYIIIQDADLEYEVKEIKEMVDFAIENKLNVLYGSRNLKKNPRSSILFSWGGKFLSFLTNLLYGSKLTDEATCYKLIKTEVIKKIPIESSRFGFCPEITAKLLRLGYKIEEIPISYYPRSIKEGKKIRFSDGLEALWILLKYRFWKNKSSFNLIDRMLRYLRLKKVLNQLNKEDLVLDLGCGPDFALYNFIKDKVKKYVGVDKELASEISDYKLELLKLNLDSIEKLPFPNFSFDKIVALALIEHLKNYQNLINECYLKLKKGGSLLITTPSPTARIILEVLANLSIISKKEIEDHKQYFTKDRIIKVLTDGGFRKENISIEDFELGLNYFVKAIK